MIELKKKRPFICILLIYLICFIFRSIEYLAIRTDQSFIGEAFIHKLLGIVVLIIAVRLFSYNWKEIGFNRATFSKQILLGLLLGGAIFLIAYTAEFFIQKVNGASPKLDFFVSSYSIDGNQIMNNSFAFVIICILGNIINVTMEEGIFRGLFIRLGEEKYAYTKSMIFSAVLFGLWHIAQAARSYIDGNITLSAAFISALGYAIMTTVGGIKYGLLVKITGSVWMGMAEHFVNNTIVNLLHIVTASGADEMQFVRISIAQTLSTIFIIIWFFKSRSKNKATFR